MIKSINMQFIAISWCLTMSSVLGTTSVHAQFNYPLSKTVNVSDNYFGTTIPDPYRWLEDLNDTEVQNWLKAQADFISQHFEKISGRDRLLNDIKKISEMRGDEVFGVYRSGNDYYYLKLLKAPLFGISM